MTETEQITHKEREKQIKEKFKKKEFLTNDEILFFVNEMAKFPEGNPEKMSKSVDGIYMQLYPGSIRDEEKEEYVTSFLQPCKLLISQGKQSKIWLNANLLVWLDQIMEPLRPLLPTYRNILKMQTFGE